MRQIQVGIFLLGVLSFLASIFFVGQEMGDVLWRTGVAAMLTAIAFVQLWPSGKRP